jgi:Ubiquitin carboxyl-terminal hydrolase
VLTHKGRSADSGHYVAWVKQPDGKWIQFDDDKASRLVLSYVVSNAAVSEWHFAECATTPSTVVVTPCYLDATRMNSGQRMHPPARR